MLCMLSYMLLTLNPNTQHFKSYQTSVNLWDIPLPYSTRSVQNVPSERLLEALSEKLQSLFLYY